MKRSLIPFYLSRATVSGVFSFLLFGVTWKAALTAAGFFAFFLLYAHSGWFVIDESQPLKPIRQDERARKIALQALAAATIVGTFTFLGASYLGGFAALPFTPERAAAILAALTFFATRFFWLARA